MPKGKHKGGKRCFTNFDELQQQKLKEQKEKEWRKARGEEEDSDEEEDDDEEGEEGEEGEEKDSSEESESSEEEEEKKPKAKGVSGLIEIENPNHITQKMKKLSTLPNAAPAAASKPQLSRKEREEVERQRATAYYRKLHAQGKTEEAKADLERLAMIRKQREEAQKRKEEEKKAKENAAAAKREKVAKALNKKESR